MISVKTVATITRNVFTKFNDDILISFRDILFLMKSSRIKLVVLVAFRATYDEKFNCHSQLNQMILDKYPFGLFIRRRVPSYADRPYHHRSKLLIVITVKMMNQMGEVCILQYL